MCAPPYACRSVTVTRGTVARPKARSSDAPWRRTPACSCAAPGRKPGVSARTTSGMPKRSQRSTNHAPFSADGGVEAAAEVLGLVGDHADRAALDAAEADDEVARPARRELQQRAAVQHARGDLAHVVDAAVALGQHVARILAGRVGRRDQRHAVPADAVGQEGQQLADQLGGVDVVAGDHVRDAVGAVHLGPAEIGRRDDLARDALDDLRAGQEHHGLGGHDHEVAQRGRVGRAAGARARHDADHRDRRLGLGAEDRRVGGQRRDALLQPRAARVREADDRDPERVGALDRPGDRLAARGAQRPALERAVLRPRDHRAALDAPAARQHAVADRGADRPERAGVEQQLQPRTGGELFRKDVEDRGHGVCGVS